MDTNLLSTLVQLLSEKQKSIAPNNTLTVVGLILTALVPTLAALAAYISSRASKASTEDTKKLTVAVAEDVAKVHLAVNSGATAMADKLEKATAEILRISQELSGLKEQQRGQVIKDATTAATVAATAAAAAVNPKG